MDTGEGPAADEWRQASERRRAERKQADEHPPSVRRLPGLFVVPRVCFVTHLWLCNSILHFRGSRSLLLFIYLFTFQIIVQKTVQCLTAPARGPVGQRSTCRPATWTARVCVGSLVLPSTRWQEFLPAQNLTQFPIGEEEFQGKDQRSKGRPPPLRWCFQAPAAVFLFSWGQCVSTGARCGPEVLQLTDPPQSLGESVRSAATSFMFHLISPSVIPKRL